MSQMRNREKEVMQDAGAVYFIIKRHKAILPQIR